MVFARRQEDRGFVREGEVGLILVVLASMHAWIAMRKESAVIMKVETAVVMEVESEGAEFVVMFVPTVAVPTAAVARVLVVSGMVFAFVVWV